jgi:hypothetical protein
MHWQVVHHHPTLLQVHSTVLAAKVFASMCVQALLALHIDYYLNCCAATIMHAAAAINGFFMPRQPHRLEDEDEEEAEVQHEDTNAGPGAGQQPAATIVTIDARGGSSSPKATEKST